MALDRLAQEIIACTRCPRLIQHCQTVAATKRRAFAEWEYWGKPIPGFGDPAAKLLVVGLAPAAHGGNRTGRMFTGDSSADWLIEAMHRYGFANQPTSTHRDDGLKLIGAYITAAARCAPPDNRPTTEELRNCQPYLEREIQLLTDVRVVLVLGQIGLNAYWKALKALDHVDKNAKRPKFGHGAEYDLGDGKPTLIVSYHPSRQNTQTGRLTKDMFHHVFARARELIDQA